MDRRKSRSGNPNKMCSLFFVLLFIFRFLNSLRALCGFNAGASSTARAFTAKLWAKICYQSICEVRITCFVVHQLRYCYFSSTDEIKKMPPQYSRAFVYVINIYTVCQLKRLRQYWRDNATKLRSLHLYAYEFTLISHRSVMQRLNILFQSVLLPTPRANFTLIVEDVSWNIYKELLKSVNNTKN